MVTPNMAMSSALLRMVPAWPSTASSEALPWRTRLHWLVRTFKAGRRDCAFQRKRRLRDLTWLVCGVLPGWATWRQAPHPQLARPPATQVFMRTLCNPHPWSCACLPEVRDINISVARQPLPWAGFNSGVGRQGVFISGQFLFLELSVLTGWNPEALDLVNEADRALAGGPAGKHVTPAAVGSSRYGGRPLLRGPVLFDSTHCLHHPTQPGDKP